MLTHRELWNHVTLTEQLSLYRNHRRTWNAVVNGLKADGLVSIKTGSIDVPVTTLIRLAKSARMRAAGLSALRGLAHASTMPQFGVIGASYRLRSQNCDIR